MNSIALGRNARRRSTGTTRSRAPAVFRRLRRRYHPLQRIFFSSTVPRSRAMVRCMDRGIGDHVPHSEGSLLISRTSVPGNMFIRGLSRLRIPFLQQATATGLKNKSEPYDSLVLSGGGIKGIAMLGSMAYLVEHDLLKGVWQYVGSSVGAVVAAVMAMGRSPDDLFSKHVLPFTYSPDIDITRLERNFGLDSGKNLEKWIDTLIPPHTTFSSLYDAHGKSLVVCVTNLNTHSAEYLSKETSPDLHVRKALRMSCSVPLYFSAVRHDGYLYVDGGVSNNFPVQQAINNGGSRVLGVQFTSPGKSRGHEWTLDSFLGSLLESNLNQQHSSSNTSIIRLQTGDVTQPLDFKLTKSKKKELYDAGFEQTRAYFKKQV